MAIRELAEKFTALLKQGKDKEASETYWSDDVVSLEAMEGEMSHLQGKDAVFKKHDWWYDNFTVHSADVEGPYIHGDQFALQFFMDTTNKQTGERSQMKEVGLYTVKDGKITQERFFY